MSELTYLPRPAIVTFDVAFAIVVIVVINIVDCHLQ